MPGRKAVEGQQAEVAAAADVLLLAVKPQQVPAVIWRITGGALDRGTLFVSIAAGVRAGDAGGRAAGRRAAGARVMPNTPCLVGKAPAATAWGRRRPRPTTELGEPVAGSGWPGVYAVEEKLLDAVTGLSGSGPAFVYVMIEALSRWRRADGAAAGRGFLALAAQTVKGAAEMVLSTGEHPALLKDRVASPGGHDDSGLAALEQGGVRAVP